MPVHMYDYTNYNVIIHGIQQFLQVRCYKNLFCVPVLYYRHVRGGCMFML